MGKPTVAVVGASNDRQKFGNKAVRAYLRQGWEVYPVNPRAETIEGLRSYRSVLEIPVAELDRIAVYVPPEVGLRLLDEFAQKPHRELNLNPGTASPELLEKAEQLGLRPILACSILAIGENPAAL
jgi:predicted CoA-binding protein